MSRAGYTCSSEESLLSHVGDPRFETQHHKIKIKSLPFSIKLGFFFLFVVFCLFCSFCGTGNHTQGLVYAGLLPKPQTSFLSFTLSLSKSNILEPSKHFMKTIMHEKAAKFMTQYYCLLRGQPALHISV